MASTPLNSKVVSKDKDSLARLCVDTVLCVADMDRRDVNLNRIKLLSKVSGDSSSPSSCYAIPLSFTPFD